MKNTPDAKLFTPMLNALDRYHLTIFIVVLVGGLSTAVLILNSTIQQSSDITGYTSIANGSSFDQVTIDRLKQLRTSSDPAPAFTLPPGRTNPFIE